MKKKRFLNYLLFVMLGLLVAGCQKDNIVLIDPIETDDSEDLIANTAFTQMVGVAFSTSGNAIVTGTNDDFAVTVSGNDVTIVYAGEEYVMYELSGTTNDGFFKLYSTKKQGITLNDASITNPNGAAINVQGPITEPSKGKRTFIVLKGENTLADGTNYTDIPDTEDEKGVMFGEGQFIFSGEGSLTVTATGRSGIVSDDYVHFISGAIAVNVSSSVNVSGSDTLKPACVRGKDYVKMTDGTLTLTSRGTGGKGISSDGNGYFYGGTVNVTVTGSNFGSSGGGGGHGGWGNSSSNGVSAKGLKFDGNLIFKGSKVVVNCTSHEGIEAKGTLSVSEGEVYSHSQSDDAINSGANLTISGGLVCAYSQGNDGLDANGNCYIKGGVVYAISASSPEVAIDANSEGGYQLYLTGGTLVAIGGLESGSSLTQSCYSASSWSQNTWYGLTVGSTTYAFKTPGSGGTPLVVSGSSTPILQSGVNVGSGTECFEGMFYTDATVSGGNSVSLSSYSGGNGGGGGPGGGGHGPF
jgi:hypothetical protein